MLLPAHAGDGDVGAHRVDVEARPARHAHRQVGFFVVAPIAVVRAVDLDAHLARRRLELELVLVAFELGDELDLVFVPGHDLDATLHVRNLDRRVGRDGRALVDLLLGRGRRRDGREDRGGQP